MNWFFVVLSWEVKKQLQKGQGKRLNSICRPIRRLCCLRAGLISRSQIQSNQSLCLSRAQAARLLLWICVFFLILRKSPGTWKQLVQIDSLIQILWKTDGNEPSTSMVAGGTVLFFGWFFPASHRTQYYMQNSVLGLLKALLLLLSKKCTRKQNTLMVTF